MDISRTHLIEELNSSMEGQDVLFGGWVVDLRKHGIFDSSRRYRTMSSNCKRRFYDFVGRIKPTKCCKNFR